MNTNSFKANGRTQNFNCKSHRDSIHSLQRCSSQRHHGFLQAVRTQQLSPDSSSPVLVPMGYLKSGELPDSAEGTWICFSRAGTHLAAASGGGSRQVQRAGQSQPSTPKAHSSHEDSRGWERWPWSTIKYTETPEEPAAGAILISPLSRAHPQDVWTFTATAV